MRICLWAFRLIWTKSGLIAEVQYKNMPSDLRQTTTLLLSSQSIHGIRRRRIALSV